MAKKEKSEYIVYTVLHALDILEQFHGDVDELGVTELSKRLRLHKNNVFRLLATLESRNYIEQNKHTENYRLGLKNLQLGQTVIKQMGLLRRARPALESLARTCNETCYLAVLKEAHVIYLDVVETGHPVRVVSRVGARLPVHCTAAGKVLLGGQRSALSLEALRHYVPTDFSLLAELEKELKKIAARGHAVEDDELDAGVRSVAAPIRDYTGNVVSAVCISGPTMRLSETRMHDELIPAIRCAADEISLQLGYCFSADIAINS